MGKDTPNFLLLLVFVVAGNLLAFGTDWLVSKLGGGTTERMVTKIAVITAIIVFVAIYIKRYRKSESDKPPED
jgi:uncharacterized membrane protein (DUF485 family)